MDDPVGKQKKNRKNLFSAITVLAVFFYGNSALAAMSSTNYQIIWDTISAGGRDDSTSSTYSLRDTIGDAAIGDSSSTSYTLGAGYRQAVSDQVISLSLIPQGSRSTPATARSGTTITVSSVEGFSLNDYILLVQNRGASQVAGFGKITSKTLTSLTIDAFTTNGTTPTIDGTNDYVYLMEGSSAGLGSISTTSVATAVIGWEVTADTPNGYSVQVEADGSLRNGSNTIDDVSDGSVTAGSEEYGAISSDTSLSTSTFDTQDSPITTTAQAVASTSDNAIKIRHFLTLKAAASTTTVSGSYNQVLTFVATGNY